MGRIQLQLSPDPAPDPFVGLSGFSPREAEGRGVVVLWWGKWGGIESKMCKNLVPPIFPRSIQKRVLFNLLCLNGDQHLSYY